MTWTELCKVELSCVFLLIPQGAKKIQQCKLVGGETSFFAHDWLFKTDRWRRFIHGLDSLCTAHTTTHTAETGFCVYSSNGKQSIEESMTTSRLAGSEFSNLCSELPLGVLGCTQVLRQLLVLNSILYIFQWKWREKKQQNSLHSRHQSIDTLEMWFCQSCVHTSFAFFCRSTIWERRCVISSCCLEASSLFLASSSDKDDICRLEFPGRDQK